MALLAVAPAFSAEDDGVFVSPQDDPIVTTQSSQKANEKAVPASRDSLHEAEPTADEKEPEVQEGKPAPTPAPAPKKDEKDKEPKVDPVAEGGDKVGFYVTEEDCIEIAILSNLGLRISRLNDRSADIDVRAAWAQYYPTFRSGINHNNTREMGEKAGDGPVTVNGGFSQLSPLGTRLDFDVSETRTKFDTDTATTNVNARITQPLWKGAGFDVGLAAIRTARINRLISRGNLDIDVQRLIFSVRTAYADVIRQVQEIEVNKQAVRSDKQFLDLTIAREQAGQVTKLDVFNAEVSLAGRKLNLITNERLLENAYDRLKQLMDVDLDERIRIDAEAIDFGEKPEPGIAKELLSDDASGTVRLIAYKDGKPQPEPKVLFQATRFNDKVVIDEALNNRIDLLNSRRNLAVQKIQSLLRKDGLGHQIDLVGNFGRSNNGHSLVETDNGREVNDWSIGINAIIPWGKITDRAAYERALLDLQTAEINLKSTRTQVLLDVRDSLRSLRENEKRLLIGGLQVENAKRTVEAAQSRFDRGLTDSFNVIRAGDDLLRAKTDFVEAKISYVVALAQLELRVGKPTGRVDLAGKTVGGLIDAKISDDLQKRGIPPVQPDAEARPEDDPLNKTPEYRKDYVPNRNDPVVIDALDEAVAKHLGNTEEEERPAKVEKKSKKK